MPPAVKITPAPEVGAQHSKTSGSSRQTSSNKPKTRVVRMFHLKHSAGTIKDIVTPGVAGHISVTIPVRKKDKSHDAEECTPSEIGMSSN